MNKSKMLLIGIGQAGNKLVSEMMKKDKRYVGLFVNSAYEDMANLEGFSPTNAFIFPGENGSGKNRENAKMFVKSHIRSLVSTVIKYPLQDTLTVFTSTDGGTGSGSTPMFLQLLRQANKSKIINLVAIIPSYKNDDKVSFENNLAFWSEIEELPEGTINDIKVIDNSKGESYADINEKAVTAIDKSYSMMGKHEIGNIDEGDSRTYNSANGFSLPLILESNYSSAKEAIDMAIESSVFAIPNSFDCDYLAISLIEKEYDCNEVRDCFDNVFKTPFKTYNNKFNMVLLTGMDAPDEAIETINMRLEELEEKEKSRKRRKKILGSVKKTNSNSKPNKSSEPIISTEEELDDIANALENLFS